MAASEYVTSSSNSAPSDGDYYADKNVVGASEFPNKRLCRQIRCAVAGDLVLILPNDKLLPFPLVAAGETIVHQAKGIHSSSTASQFTVQY